MSRHVIGLVFLLSCAFGHTIRDLKCDSYANLLRQYKRCHNSGIPDKDWRRLRELSGDEKFTKAEVIEMMEIYCRVYIPSETEKQCFRIGCVKDSEMAGILDKWGGFCDGNGQLLYQARQLFTDFQYFNTSNQCITKRQNALIKCFSTEIFDVVRSPNPSMNIYDGIKKLESARKSYLKCSLEKLKKSPIPSCGRIRDLQIQEIFGVIMIDPLGIGSYLDLAPFIAKLSSN